MLALIDIGVMYFYELLNVLKISGTLLRCYCSHCCYCRPMSLISSSLRVELFQLKQFLLLYVASGHSELI